MGDRATGGPRQGAQAVPGFGEQTLPYLKPLVRLALRLTGDPAAAEDLVQETYLRALQSFSTLREPARVRPWLFQILSRLVIDRHRATSREVPLEDPDELDRFSLYDQIANEDPLPYADNLHDEFLAQFPDEEVRNALLACLRRHSGCSVQVGGSLSPISCWRRPCPRTYSRARPHSPVDWPARWRSQCS